MLLPCTKKMQGEFFIALTVATGASPSAGLWMCTVCTCRDEALGLQLCRALDGKEKEGQGYAKLPPGYV